MPSDSLLKNTYIIAINTQALAEAYNSLQNVRISHKRIFSKCQFLKWYQSSRRETAVIGT